MGGLGSGRRSYSRDTTSDYQQLDVREWQRLGFLVQFAPIFTRGGWTVNVVLPRYLDPAQEWVVLSRTEKERPVNVKIEWTACNYGGRRAWLRCPNEGCNRRVAILYADHATVACRRCRDLAYESQQESAKYRALHAAQEIRQKLGGSGVVVDPFPEKPKYMHWRTYWIKQIKANQHEQRYFWSLAIWLFRQRLIRSTG
jgi:hypothetical protein